MKCPFRYADGKQCEGHITEIVLVKHNVHIELNGDDVKNVWFDGRYHVRLNCSLKGGHSRSGIDDRMKLWYDELPDEIRNQAEKGSRR